MRFIRRNSMTIYMYTKITRISSLKSIEFLTFSKESIQSEHETSFKDPDSSTFLDKKTTLIEILDKFDDKTTTLPTENSKEASLDERLSLIEKKFHIFEENISSKVLDLNLKKKKNQKSLQIMEKNEKSDEDLNLIWKTINTIVINSKVYVEDVKKDLEKRIGEMKEEVNGLMNCEDVKGICEEVKKNGLEGLVTEKKCKGMLDGFKGEVQEFFKGKLGEMLESYKKLNDLIEKEK